MILVFVVAALVYVGGCMWLLQDGRAHHVEDWGRSSWIYLLTWPILFAIIPITMPLCRALGWVLRKKGRI